jgi:hypothetical protein
VCICVRLSACLSVCLCISSCMSFVAVVQAHPSLDGAFESSMTVMHILVCEFE